MAVSYKKLWKLLIDKDMKKKELEQQANVSHYTVSKMYRGENVTIDILERICKTLDCSLDDIVEFVPDEKTAKEWSENNCDNYPYFCITTGKSAALWLMIE